MALFNSILGRVVVSTASIVRSGRAFDGAAVSRWCTSLGQFRFSTATNNYRDKQSIVDLEGRAFEVKADDEGTPYLQCKHGRDEIIKIRVNKTNSQVRGFEVKENDEDGTTPYLECKYVQLDDKMIKIEAVQTNSKREKAYGHPMIVEIKYGDNHDKLLTFKIKAFPDWIYVPRWSLSNGESGDLGEFRKYFDKRGINLGMTNILFNHIADRNQKTNSIVRSYNSAPERRQPRFSTTQGSSTEEDIIRALETNYDQMNIIGENQHEQSGRNEESDDKTSVLGVNKESDSSVINPDPNTNKGCSIPDILRAIPDEFTIGKISLGREFQGELISIDIDYIEEEEEVNPDQHYLVLDVCTRKEKGPYDFKFDLTASTDHLALHNITGTTTTHFRSQPGIHLDGFDKFLAERGINPSVTKLHIRLHSYKKNF